jgi:hypothetical protein
VVETLRSDAGAHDHDLVRVAVGEDLLGSSPVPRIGILVDAQPDQLALAADHIRSRQKNGTPGWGRAGCATDAFGRIAGADDEHAPDVEVTRLELAQPAAHDAAPESASRHITASTNTIARG